MAKNGKKGKKDKKDTSDKRSRVSKTMAPVGDLSRAAPAALAVAFGGFIVAGITSLWRTRR